MIRPKIDNLFASEAMPEDIGDPDVFVPTNPSYPSQAENQYRVGWFVEGDTVTKQPHQWINFFYNGIDRGIYSHASRYNYWSPKVEYEFEAIVYHGANFFKALKQHPTSTPALISTEWEVCFTTLEEFMILINEVIGATDVHMVREVNPHNVTPDQIDAYTIEEVDTGLQQTVSSLEAHKTGTNPHEVSYDQLGVLPVEGGVFLGEVAFPSIGLSRGRVLSLQAAIRIEAFGTRFGVRADTGLNKDSYNVVSFQNLEALKKRNNPLFKERTPDVVIPLNGDLNFFSNIEELVYTGDSYIFTNYLGEVITLSVNTPGFNQGLHINPSANQSLSLDMPFAVSVFAIVDKTPTFAYISNGSVNLIEALGATSSLRDVRIWCGELNEYFKSTLIGV